MNQEFHDINFFLKLSFLYQLFALLRYLFIPAIMNNDDATKQC